MSVLLIARHTLHETARKRLLLAVLVLTVVFLAVYGVGSQLLADEIRQGAGRGPGLPLVAALMCLMAFYIVAFLGSLLAIFVAVGSIAGEVETGTILALAARPIRRWQIVAGKWAALALLVACYLVVVSTGVLVLSQRSTAYVPPNPAGGIALIVLESVLLLSLTVLGSTALSTLTNGAVVFMLYGVAWVGGLVESIGSIFGNTAMINAGIIASLLVPSDALWKGASFHLQPVAMILAQNASPAANPFAAATPMTLPMLAYSLVYTAICLALAMRVFSARDL